MIDTDKYKGHSTTWTLDYNGWTWAESMFTAAGETNEADALLIQDAPLLLQEVKRLRERLSMWESWFNQGADNKMQDGDVWDIMFHNHECPNGKDCDGKCWNCETKELIG